MATRPTPAESVIDVMALAMAAKPLLEWIATYTDESSKTDLIDACRQLDQFAQSLSAVMIGGVLGDALSVVTSNETCDIRGFHAALNTLEMMCIPMIRGAREQLQLSIPGIGTAALHAVTPKRDGVFR
jgi:hypothetical protein